MCSSSARCDDRTSPAALPAWLLLGGPLALVTLALAACQPGLALKRSQRFKPEVSKTVLWEDRCSLQSHFDLPLPPHEVISETESAVHMRGGKMQTRGTSSLRIRHPLHRDMLSRLLRRYYVNPPSLRGISEVQVRVGYYRYCASPRPLVGGAVELRIGQRWLTLAYHPCMGEFLLNGDLYAFRRKMIEEGELRVAAHANLSE